VRIDTRTLSLDLEDTLFCSKEEELRQVTHNKVRVDLNGTLFKFKNGDKVMEISKDDDEEVDLSKIKLAIDRDELIKKYQFVWDYAPKMWLDENLEDTGMEGVGYFPSSVEYFFEHVTGINDDGSIRLTTIEELEKPYTKLDWFNGVAPINGTEVPTYTTILPFHEDLATNDAVEMILNPDKYRVVANYIYFFPYDWVKYGFGNHVGDLEHTSIYFDGGAPFQIYVSQHAWGDPSDWNDPVVEKDGIRPVVYNAQGTHATYWTAGKQWYDIVVCDLTA
jgi:hypothetical protein